MPRRFRRRAFPALPSILLSAGGGTPAAPALALLPEPAGERGVPALFSWGDADGDGRLDLAAVQADGTLRILASTGDGRFEDVTRRVGLADVGEAALAAWADYDGDGRLDLFVGAHAGASRLYRNDLYPNNQGAFVDMTAASGLALEGAVRSAEWLDHDGDGHLDLFAVTERESALSTTLFRGLEGGFFEPAELPLGGAGPVARPARVGAGAGASAPGTTPDPGSASAEDVPRAGRESLQFASAGGRTVRSPSPTAGGGPLLPVLSSCLTAIRDVASGSCLTASSTPTLGMLYPLSANLFVAKGGNVGIGTTSPAARLDVAGSARVAGALTLEPGADKALDVKTGSIYKAGAPFLHTRGGANNTAVGREALAAVTSGSSNTAGGHRALFANTSGFGNTAGGDRALYANTVGYGNTAAGARALSANTSGDYNTATGYRALSSSTTANYNTANGHKALTLTTTGGYNTASGANALRFNTTGAKNSAHGARALFSNTTGSFNTASGGEALRANTTGQRNTASGYRALYSNTTGSSNTASGAEALRANTTGLRNTATGYRALYANTTGGFNTATGEGALRANTSGFRNTATGYRTLYSNTTGYSNTATGNRALFSNTTGFENTASGVRALRANTAGHSNTASGAYSLYLNTTGHYNTATGNLALYSNATGYNNTAVGFGALAYATAGYNTASGSRALFSSTTGSANVASGYAALYASTTGGYNSAHGTLALALNTTGNSNTASGTGALYKNTSGSQNTAVGNGALFSNTIGSYNIALGPFAGYNLTTGSDNIAIGNPGVAGEGGTTRIGEPGIQKRAFVAGIRGVTTGMANGIAVLVDSNGQLGTVSSSLRFKEEIRDMGDATEELLALRPVVFRYKPEVQSGERPLEYGLIAEEVAEVFPDLVVRDEQGRPFTVKYHLLSAMLLNELKKLHAAQAHDHRELEEVRAELAQLRGLETRLGELEARASRSPAATPAPVPGGGG
jgi:hypothetical protein